MDIVIFGATGATGRELVTRALDRNHGVTAFVRDPDRLGIPGPEVVCGDVLDPAAVQGAFGNDTVSCLFHLPDVRIHAGLARPARDGGEVRTPYRSACEIGISSLAPSSPVINGATARAAGVVEWPKVAQGLVRARAL